MLYLSENCGYSYLRMSLPKTFWNDPINNEPPEPYIRITDIIKLNYDKYVPRCTVSQLLPLVFCSTDVILFNLELLDAFISELTPKKNKLNLYHLDRLTAVSMMRSRTKEDLTEQLILDFQPTTIHLISYATWLPFLNNEHILKEKMEAKFTVRKNVFLFILSNHDNLPVSFVKQLLNNINPKYYPYCFFQTLKFGYDIELDVDKFVVWDSEARQVYNALSDEQHLTLAAIAEQQRSYIEIERFKGIALMMPDNEIYNLALGILHTKLCDIESYSIELFLELCTFIESTNIRFNDPAWDRTLYFEFLDLLAKARKKALFLVGSEIRIEKNRYNLATRTLLNFPLDFCFYTAFNLASGYLEPAIFYKLRHIDDNPLPFLFDCDEETIPLLQTSAIEKSFFKKHRDLTPYYFHVIDHCCFRSRVNTELDAFTEWLEHANDNQTHNAIKLLHLPTEQLRAIEALFHQATFQELTLLDLLVLDDPKHWIDKLTLIFPNEHKWQESDFTKIAAYIDRTGSEIGFNDLFMKRLCTKIVRVNNHKKAR